MFYDNYVRLCNAAGKTPSAVAVEIGIQKSTVTRWSQGTTPNRATALKVADYFGVSVNDLYSPTLTADCNLQLFGGAEEQQKKPNDQKAIGLKDTGYELLTPENRSVIDSLIVTLLKSQSGE